MEECHESSEGASVNANRILRNWGCNMDRRPQAGGPYFPPISRNEVGIYRCARARLMAFTLLLHKLKPQKERKSSDWSYFKCYFTIMYPPTHWSMRGGVDDSKLIYPPTHWSMRGGGAYYHLNPPITHWSMRGGVHDSKVTFKTWTIAALSFLGLQFM